MCLQNTIFSDLCDSPRLMSLVSISKIRSLHLHFQFHEVNFEVDDSIAIEEFRYVLEKTTQCLPSLRILSIFLQGPLSRVETFTYFGSLIERVCIEINTLEQVIVRFPRACWDKQPFRNKLRLESISRLLDRDNIHFQIRQSRITMGQRNRDVVDELPELNSGWKVGTFYMDGCKEDQMKYFFMQYLLGRKSVILRLEQLKRGQRTIPRRNNIVL